MVLQNYNRKTVSTGGEIASSRPGGTRANSLVLAHHNHHTSSLGPVALFSPFFKCVRYIRVA